MKFSLGTNLKGLTPKMIAEDEEVLAGYKERVRRALKENPNMVPVLSNLLSKGRAQEELLRALQSSSFTEDQAKEILLYMYKGTDLYYKHSVPTTQSEDNNNSK